MRPGTPLVLWVVLLALACTELENPGGNGTPGPALGDSLLKGAVNHPGPYPTEQPVSFLDLQGQRRTVLAYPGQVLLFFDPEGQVPDSTRLAQMLGGLGGASPEILQELPLLGIFLVQVGPGAEQAFITDALETVEGLQLAIPNAVAAPAGEVELDNSCWVDACVDEGGKPVTKFVPLNVGAGVVVMDDFHDRPSGNHGEDVYQTVLNSGGEVSSRVQVPVLAGGLVPTDKLVASVVAAQDGAALFVPGQTVVTNLSFNAAGEQSPNYQDNWYALAAAMDAALNATNARLSEEQRRRFILVQALGNAGKDVSAEFGLIRQRQLASGTAANHLFVGATDGSYSTRVDDPTWHDAVAWYKGCISPTRCGTSFASPAVAAMVYNVARDLEVAAGAAATAVAGAIRDDPTGEPFMIESLASSRLRITLEPDEFNLGPEGGQGSFSVQTSEGRDWTAQSDSAWLTVLTGAAGVGPGTVSWSAQPFSGSFQRLGIINVSGEKFFLTQYPDSDTGACCCKATCPCGGYPSPICAEQCPCCLASCRWSQFPNCDNEGDHDYRCVTTDSQDTMTQEQCSPAQCWDHVAW